MTEHQPEPQRPLPAGHQFRQAFAGLVLLTMVFAALASILSVLGGNSQQAAPIVDKLLDLAKLCLLALISLVGVRVAH